MRPTPAEPQAQPPHPTARTAAEACREPRPASAPRAPRRRQASAPHRRQYVWPRDGLSSSDSKPLLRAIKRHGLVAAHRRLAHRILRRTRDPNQSRPGRDSDDRTMAHWHTPKPSRAAASTQATIAGCWSRFRDDIPREPHNQYCQKLYMADSLPGIPPILGVRVRPLQYARQRLRCDRFAI
jgi:hypothetical protein